MSQQKTVKTVKRQLEFKLALPNLIEPLDEQSSEQVKFKGGMPDRRIMERGMANLQIVLEGHAFEGVDELNDFVSKKKGELSVAKPRTSLQKA